MSDFKTLLAEAKLPRRTVRLCLRGDLIAEHEDLDRQLKALRLKVTTKTAGDEADAAGLAEQITELEAAMDAASVTFTLEALSRFRFEELKAANPPREGDDADEQEGVNIEAFADALIRASVVDPVISEQEWVELAAVLTSKGFEDLYMAALLLNRGETSVPFSLSASRVIQQRSAGRTQPEPTA